MKFAPRSLVPPMRTEVGWHNKMYATSVTRWAWVAGSNRHQWVFGMAFSGDISRRDRWVATTAEMGWPSLRRFMRVIRRGRRKHR